MISCRFQGQKQPYCNDIVPSAKHMQQGCGIMPCEVRFSYQELHVSNGPGLKLPSVLCAHGEYNLDTQSRHK